MSNGLRQRFIDHLADYATHQEIEIGLLNCWLDHVHCLIRLKPDQNLVGILTMLKGESAHWINSNHLTEKRFNWAGDYFAASVSEGNLNGVHKYILGQERHHAHRTYKEEVEAYFSASRGVPSTELRMDLQLEVR